MKLVKMVNYLLLIEDELLLLKPFKTVYKKDKTRDKSKFLDFMTILYFTYDPRSDYSYITNETERLKEVCDTNGFDIPKFTLEERECISLYKLLTTTISLELLLSTKVAISKVKDFLENVDLNALDDKGKPVHTINSITTAIKLIPLLAKDIMEAEKAVAKEIAELGRARGGNEKKALMEDGISI